ncbi:hypothetical protein LCGC14_0378090 [marine sediment metagenome]|uniref:Uncharacterized protein n=1 Tax=marine sediment metagenome TaxID=412755 RepID=A0A0F9VQE7_9ZZZZ
MNQETKSRIVLYCFNCEATFVREIFESGIMPCDCGTFDCEPAAFQVDKLSVRVFMRNNPNVRL